MSTRTPDTALFFTLGPLCRGLPPPAWRLELFVLHFLRKATRRVEKSRKLCDGLANCLTSFFADVFCSEATSRCLSRLRLLREFGMWAGGQEWTLFWHRWHFLTSVFFEGRQFSGVGHFIFSRYNLFVMISGKSTEQRCQGFVKLFWQALGAIEPGVYSFLN